MRSAKVSELKANLSRYLARVKRGEEVVVTERGEPIARLVPLPPVGDADAEWTRLRDLERRGLIVLQGTGALPDDLLEEPPCEDPGGAVLRALLEERESGR